MAQGNSLERTSLGNKVGNQKTPSTRRSEKNIDDLYKVLAPGCAVEKTDRHTLVILEPDQLNVVFRNSEIAKCGGRE